MHNDIVARLRQSHRVGCDCFGCEAADEIERLREVVEAWLQYSRRAERDIETLRAELRTYTGDGHNTKGEPCTQNTPS